MEKSDPISQFKITLNELKSLLTDIESDVCCKDLNEEQDNFVELGDLPSRIIHLNLNPHYISTKEGDNEYELLLKENEQLKARLSLIESGCDANVTMRISEAVNNAHQIEILTQTVIEYKNREKKILTSLKKTAGEFREACFSLIGYRVDALKDNIYRLSNRYASSDDEKLFFEVKRDGTISLMKNAYSDRFLEYQSSYLNNGDSFPAFLAAITLDLFKSFSEDQTMDMSTTLIANSTVRPRNTNRLR